MASLISKLSSVVIGGSEHPTVEIDQIPPGEILENDPCSACEDPCQHPMYPSYLSLDNESELLGSMSPYGRHLMISTGQCDWAERIEEDEGSLAAAIQSILRERPCNWRTFVTNTSMETTHSTVPGAQDVVIFPDNIIVSNVTPEKAEAFYHQFICAPLPEQPIHLQDPKYRQEFPVRHCKYDAMILICSHKKRDKRCGITAPILARQFDHVLREKEIPEGNGGTAIVMVSHVGGHKFAGNIICYTHQGTRGVWYGRVKSCHCEDIVEETIMKGRVIKELYRGSMTHSYGRTCANRHRW